MKKLNIKALFVDHFEKMLLAVFGVIVLAVLATTSWARIEDTPEKLKGNIETVKKKIESSENVWADRAAYKVVDYKDQANKLFNPIPSGQFEFSTPLFHPLQKKNEPRKEPTFLPVQELTAKASLVALSMRLAPTVPTLAADDTKPGATTATGTAKPAAAAAVDENNPFADRRQVAAKNPTNPATPGVAGNVPAARPAAGGGSFAMKIGRDKDEDEDNGGGMSTQNAGYDPNVTSRGVRVIAVRGVFPIRQQIDEFKKSLHLNEQEAAALMEIADFVLERQTAVAGEDPWKNSKWQTVDVQNSKEILNESSGSDVDPVPIRMQDNVITMSLPLRLLGYWDESATHPRIQSEELKTEEDFAKQDKLLEALAETVGESNLVEQSKPRRRGMANTQSDVKSLAGTVMGNAKANQMLNQKLGQMQPNGRPAVGGPGAANMNLIMGEARYLLFRYFDFDVQSGLAYRYRVRLKLRNPNFEATEEQLAAADPNIKRGEERDTPWSAVSNPEVVPATVAYFLKDVERDPYREPQVKTSTGKHVVQLAMYDFDTKLGTIINDVLNVFSMGSFLSGETKKETLVLDVAQPADQQLQKKKHTFVTSDVLLDVETDAELSPEQHPDLKFANEKARGVVRLGLLEEALIFTSLGELKPITVLDGRAEEDLLARRVRGERSGREVASNRPPTVPGMALGNPNDPANAAARRTGAPRRPRFMSKKEE